MFHITASGLSIAILIDIYVIKYKAIRIANAVIVFLSFVSVIKIIEPNNANIIAEDSLFNVAIIRTVAKINNNGVLLSRKYLIE